MLSLAMRRLRITVAIIIGRRNGSVATEADWVFCPVSLCFALDR